MKTTAQLYEMREVIKGNDELEAKLGDAWSETMHFESAMSTVISRGEAMVRRITETSLSTHRSPIDIAVAMQHEIISTLSNMSIDQLTRAGAKAEVAQAAWMIAVNEFWGEK